MSYSGNRELVGHVLPADATLEIVEFTRTNGHDGWGIRRSDDAAIATFGSLTGYSDRERAEYLEDCARRFRDQRGVLGWTEVSDSDYPVVKVPADVDWATATDATPVDTIHLDATRTAQGRALATMRQREAAATARAEQAEQRVTTALAQRDAETDKLRELWAALAEQAEDRQWCGEFEEFYANNGGEEYLDLNSEFDVTIRVSVQKRASHVNSDVLRDAIYDLSSYDIEIVDYNAVE